MVIFSNQGALPEWILTAKQERALTQEEREAYFEKLYQYCKERDLEVTTDGATTLGPKLKGFTNKLDVGLILVTKNKDYPVRRAQAKLDMISALIKGHSVIIFPETTWNFVTE